LSSIFKIVRNRVPELFEIHHGYPPELAAENLTTSSLNRMWLAKAKLEEELAELNEAAFSDGSREELYEEAADLYESILAMLMAYDADSHSDYDDTERELWETINRKQRELGSYSDFRVARITQKEKEHYYSKIKTKGQYNE